MISKELYDEIRLNGKADYDIDERTYISVGTYGLTIYRVSKNGKKVKSKYVSEWRKKSLEQINDELKEKEWKENK